MFIMEHQGKLVFETGIQILLEVYYNNPWRLAELQTGSTINYSNVPTQAFLFYAS